MIMAQMYSSLPGAKIVLVMMKAVVVVAGVMEPLGGVSDNGLCGGWRGMPATFGSLHVTLQISASTHFPISWSKKRINIIIILIR